MVIAMEEAQQFRVLAPPPETALGTLSGCLDDPPLEILVTRLILIGGNLLFSFPPRFDEVYVPVV